MTVPVDTLIQHSLQRMRESLAEKAASGVVTNEQSGLLYLGNIHDALPRQLFLDTRLSALDKLAWVMIRMAAQLQDGAIFPTYDQLQYQLASPQGEKASRETVSRALLMLRLTGWLSLCKRVRDARGRVRGNIYAQHDEPLECHDAEYFDPGWLDMVEQACCHSNKTVRLTARALLTQVKGCQAMRHRYARIAVIEARLATRLASADPALSSLPALPKAAVTPSCESELSIHPQLKPQVGKSNRYVEKLLPDIKNTPQSVSVESVLCPVLHWPQTLARRLTDADRQRVEQQLLRLPAGFGQLVIDDLTQRLPHVQVRNVAAYLLANARRVRQGQFNVAAKGPGVPATADVVVPDKPQEAVARAAPEFIAQVMAGIRGHFSGPKT